jgi:hypothetical protein
MIATRPIVLSGDRVHALLRPDEGGVVETLLVDGRPVLARTPWAETVRPSASPARTEAEWVARWRGGWQLCFPTAGQPDPDATPAQGFHGVASQVPWSLVEATGERTRLTWSDGLGLTAERTWRLTADGLEVETIAGNDGPEPRAIAVAEHLVLGGDILAPVLAGATLTLEGPAGGGLGPLDYNGRPTGSPVAWPGDPADRWSVIDAATPPRVGAFLGGGADAAGSRWIAVRGDHVLLSVTWSGLPHALVWEELGASREAPWNGAVVALGIEPTSTPHGSGTAAGHGLVTLLPGARLTWRTALAVRWVAP